MALIRWQPFQEMNALQRDMNRLFDSLAPMSQETMMKSAFAPPAEMEETEDAFQIRLELPGMDSNDLDVQVTREAIMISGERKSESKSEENGMTRSEFRYGRFSRTIPLPTRIDNTNVQSDYKDGILTLSLPKAEEEKNKVVKVNVARNNSDSSQS